MPITSNTHTHKVAMTYSGELFMCMVMGLLLGHGIFNTSKIKIICSVYPSSPLQELRWLRVLTLAAPRKQLRLRLRKKNKCK